MPPAQSRDSVSLRPHPTSQTGPLANHQKISRRPARVRPISSATRPRLRSHASITFPKSNIPSLGSHPFRLSFIPPPSPFSLLFSPKNQTSRPGITLLSPPFDRPSAVHSFSTHTATTEQAVAQSTDTLPSKIQLSPTYKQQDYTHWSSSNTKKTIASHLCSTYIAVAR